MRVVVAAHPYVGHLRIPVQLATYLSRQGHTVAIVTGTGHEAVRALVPWDFPTFAVDGGFDAARLAAVVPPDVARGDVEAVASILVGGRAPATVGDLVRVLEQFRPDVVLRDNTHVLAAVAAARAGVPEISLLLIPEATTQAARQAFTSVQRRAGLPVAGDTVSSVRNISFLPDGFYEDDVPEVVHRRVDLDAGSIRTEPDAPGDVAPADVLATFGTVSYPVKVIVKVAPRSASSACPPSWRSARSGGTSATGRGPSPATSGSSGSSTRPACCRAAGCSSATRASTACGRRSRAAAPCWSRPSWATSSTTPAAAAGSASPGSSTCGRRPVPWRTSIAAALDDPGLRRAAAAQQRALLGAPSARDIGAVLAEAVAAP